MMPLCFVHYYDVTEEGNWEGKNILYTSLTLNEFAEANNWMQMNLATSLKKAGKIW